MIAEVRIMKVCTHPNIVKFYGAWLKDDELFVMIYFSVCNAPFLHTNLFVPSDCHGALRWWLRSRSLSRLVLINNLEFFSLLYFSRWIVVLRKPLTEEQIVLVMHGALEALQYLHTKLNILHRDIKAANFLLTDEGKLKLSMFIIKHHYPFFILIHPYIFIILVNATFLAFFSPSPSLSSSYFWFPASQLTLVWARCWRTRRRSARV